MWSHLWPGEGFWGGFDALYPNILASILVGTVLWIWKVRPHFRRQRERQLYTHRLLENLHRHHRLPLPEGEV